MRYVIRSAAAAAISCLVFMVLVGAAAAETRFSHQGIAADALRYEAYITKTFSARGQTAAKLKSEAETLFKTDVRAASQRLAQAVAAAPKDDAVWTRLAEALLAITPAADQSNERWDLPIHASGAAYRGYQLAKTDAARANALRVLGDALQRRSYWRPAIDAYHASLEISDDPTLRATYQRLRDTHGFRMTNYTVDNESVSPRICLEFSEPLRRSETDFSKYFSLDGADPQAFTVENQQVCFEGLKHGNRYVVQARAGLPSDVGEELQKSADVAAYVPDRSAIVRFTGKSYVLPSRGQQGIPVVSTNTARIAVDVFRIGDRSLVQSIQNGDMQRQLWPYELEELKNRSAVRVYAGTMDVAKSLNEDVTTAVPVTDATGQLEPGAYVMVAKPADVTKDSGGQLATQWFIVSDLGLTALNGPDGMHVFVRSLATTDPIAASAVKLVARNNEVLATANTDAKGYAHFAQALTKGDGGAQPAIIVAEKGEGEYAFLDLTASAFDLSDRGVKGREPAGPIDAYVYTERGVYRAGEDVQVTSILRGSDGNAVSVPATVIVKRPDGVEHTRFLMNDQGLGGSTTSVHIAKTAMTGTWRLWLHTDPKAPAIAERAFLVEDFVPERLDMTLNSADKVLRPGTSHAIAAAGRYLFGPPASGLSLDGEVIVRAGNADVEGYAGYTFGQASDLVSPVRQALDTGLIMDDSGNASLSIVLPAIPKTAKPLEADVVVRLLEPGGRSIERKITVPVDAGLARIGIKPLFDNGRTEENADAGFDVVSIAGDGKPTSGEALIWTLTRLDTSWQWYRRDGNWSYDSVTLKRKVAEGTVATAGATPVRINQAIGYGRYRLDVASPLPGGAASSILFSAGWNVSGEEIDSPEQVEVALDKPAYAPGETAKLRIASKAGGKALVAILGAKAHDVREIDVPAGGGEVALTVGNDWGAGAYVTALVYRAMDESAKRMPSRAIGVAWLGLNNDARTLKIGLNAPDKVKAGDSVTVPVKIDGIPAGEQAFVTVAAVDLGILNLTRFESPDPAAWFNAQSKLAFDIRDYYGRLIDGMKAERGSLRSGGDAGAPVMQGNPTVETVVSLFSGIVRVGDDGAASVTFDMPDFNGTVRLMAVAWSKGKLGHATKDMLVRDRVAMTIAVPRFMTLGDEIQLGFDVHNLEGPAGAYTLSLSKVVGADTSSHTVTKLQSAELTLDPGKRELKRITFKPDDVGQLTLRADITGPDNIAIKRDMTFDVLPPAADIKRTTVSSIDGKGGSISVSSDLVADLIASRTMVNVSVGPAARFDVPSLLAKLDRYPYGCAEQTVSRALPLLYANAVATTVGMGADKDLKARVQSAVSRVFELQDSSGAFGAWGPSSEDLWLTAYVSDFLTRARENGATVPAEAFNRALDRLQNFLNYASDFEKGGEDRAYALYVLARNSRAPIGELRYYVDTRLDRFASPLAKAQIGAALSMMGDKPRAERAFEAALAMLDDTTDDSGYRSDYGSTLRDGAALLTLASETGLANADKPKLATVIAKAYETRQYTSTQEQAWMLLAANALNDDVKAANLSVNGAPVAAPLFRALTAAEVRNGDLVVRNDGEAAIDAVVSVIGAGLTPEPAISKDFTIERKAFTLDGKPVDMASLGGGSATASQNDRFVMVVSISSPSKGGRVMVVDRLPAGFEIENPRLVESGAITGLDWLKSTANPEHTEFRDDRFVAAFNFSDGGNENNDGDDGEHNGAEGAEATPEAAAGNGVTLPGSTATVAYIVRAVTPGTFVHPAATVEDMYRPDRYARTDAGTLTITAKE